MKNDVISFSFGLNWKNYVSTIDDDNLKGAENDLVEWIGGENIVGKEVLDIGSGSGIHSYCFYRLGASKIFSFDYDIHSVEATKAFWVKASCPSNWSIAQGSILDDSFISKLQQADIVYSWGVLHHTGDMWRAIENAAKFVRKNGYFFISIYAKGPKYKEHLELKKRFNRSSWFGKKIMIFCRILRQNMWPRLKNRKNPFTWNKKKARGMNVYHDIIDWLGGLPYEVAYESEITDFLDSYGLKLVKMEARPEGGCNRLLYKKANG